MGVVPNTLNEKIQFFEERLPVWAVNPTLIGLSPADIVTLSNLTTQARADYEEARTARNNAQAKTLVQNESVNAMGKFGGDAVKTIRVTAQRTNNPNIYALAQIPPPAEPTPLGPAETPTDVTSTLLNGGSVELTWKGSREGGTSFRIFRSTKTPDAEPTNFQLIGTSEERKFTDDTLPIGLANATYYIVAVRSGGSSGNSDVSTIFFGSGASNPGQSSSPNLTIAA